MWECEIGKWISRVFMGTEGIKNCFVERESANGNKGWYAGVVTDGL